MEIWILKDTGVRILTFWGHVTIKSPRVVPNRWSVEAIRLIFHGYKDIEPQKFLGHNLHAFGSRDKEPRSVSRLSAVRQYSLHWCHYTSLRYVTTVACEE